MAILLRSPQGHRRQLFRRNDLSEVRYQWRVDKGGEVNSPLK